MIRRLGGWLTFAGLALSLALPGHANGLLGGLPLGPLALGSAVLLGLGLFIAWPLTPSRWTARVGLMALSLAIAKLGLALAAPRYGLESSYFANDRFNNVPESSTMTPGTPYTRLDRELDFGSDEFPLFFFNDSERFNMLGGERFDRGKVLTWSAIWSGYLQVPEPRSVTLWLTASGPGEMTVAGQRLWRVDADGRATAEAKLTLPGGPQPIEIRYARKKERSGFLQVASDLSGRRAPLRGAEITAEPYTVDQLRTDALLGQVARGVDAAIVGLLVGWLFLVTANAAHKRLRMASALNLSRVERWLAALERPLLALVPFGLFLQATLPRLDRQGKMVFLAGGQDWLTHETLAREIQFNGPLMTLGEPLGQGALYYAQPLYPYYLALLHTLSGEDLFGVLALQVLGLGVACVLIYFLGRELFGVMAGVGALTLMLGVLVPFELGWVARLLISEALFFWLLPAAVLGMLVLGRRRPEPGLAALAGALLGLACVTRGPTLLYLPLAGLLLWRLLRETGQSRTRTRRLLAVWLLAAGLVIGLVPIRNQIVAGKPALTASSGGVNLQKLHRPSKQVRLAGADDDPLYNALGLDRPTREVLEYARQEPLEYVRSYLPLAAYSLGFGFALNDLVDEQLVQLHPGLIGLDLLYLAALVAVPVARGTSAGLLHAYVAVHLLTMVVFAPYDYENRLVTPMYILVAVVGGGLLGQLARLLRAEAAEHRQVAPSSVAAAGR